jgi:hypothetical protein
MVVVAEVRSYRRVLADGDGGTAEVHSSTPAISG